MLKFIKLNDDKSPVTSFDTTYKSMETLNGAGLLLNSKVCIVDFDGDNYDDKKMFSYLDKNHPTLYIKNKRGRHYYYSLDTDVKINNGADKITISGYQVDYKTGNKAYAIVKLNGKERERNQDLTLKNLPALPKILYPLPKTSKNLTMLAEGDSRNNSIFYHLRCIREMYPKISIPNMGSVVNGLAFIDKLDKKELDAVIKSSMEAKIHTSTWNGDASDIFSMGEYVADKLDIKVYNGLLYFKEGVTYCNDGIKLDRAIDKIHKLSKTQFTNINKRLYMEGELVEGKNFKVKLRNGTIVDGDVVNMTSGFTPFYLDVEYDPKAYNKDVDKFLNFVSKDRKDLREYIENILGHVLMINSFPHKLFFLTGAGANGKSTFMEMLNAFAGTLSGTIDLKGFDDGTSLLSLVGKLVNVADDVDPLYLEKSKNLKTMASGNTISTRAIYGHPVQFKNTATMIFTANEPPTFKDKSKGIVRRLVIVPFENTVKKVTLN